MDEQQEAIETIAEITQALFDAASEVAIRKRANPVQIALGALHFAGYIFGREEPSIAPEKLVGILQEGWNAGRADKKSTI